MAQIDFATDASCQMLREFLCVYCYISWFFCACRRLFFLFVCFLKSIYGLFFSVHSNMRSPFQIWNQNC